MANAIPSALDATGVFACKHPGRLPKTNNARHSMGAARITVVVALAARLVFAKEQTPGSRGRFPMGNAFSDHALRGRRHLWGLPR